MSAIPSPVFAQVMAITMAVLCLPTLVIPVVILLQLSGFKPKHEAVGASLLAVYGIADVAAIVLVHSQAWTPCLV